MLTIDMPSGALIEGWVWNKMAASATTKLKTFFVELLPSDVDFERLGRQTAGFSFTDFESLLRKAHGSALARFDVLRFRGHPKMNCEDVEGALKEMQSLLADSIGAPKIPDVKWEDIGEFVMC